MRELTAQIGDLSAKDRGGVEAGGVAVGVADAPRSECTGTQDGIKADRGCVPTDDQDISPGPLRQSVDDSAIGVDDIVGNRRQGDVVDRLGRGNEHVLGVRHQQQVRDTATVTAAGLTESERRTGTGLIGFAGGVVPFGTGPTGAARHLEGHRDPLSGPQPRHTGADGDHFGGDLMADRVRAGEDAEGRHGDIKITPRHREWTDNRVSVPGFRVGNFLPLEFARLEEH